MTKLTFNSVSMFKKRYCAACAANGLLATEAEHKEETAGIAGTITPKPIKRDTKNYRSLEYTGQPTPDPRGR